MLCPKLPIWDLCQRPRPRVGSPRRLIMLTNAHSQVSQRVMSVTDIHRDREGGSWVSECHEIQMPPSLSLCRSEMPGNVTRAPVTGPRVSQCPKVQCQVCLGQGPALGWDALWETIRPGRCGVIHSKQLKPMSNMIVLALVVIWNCNVSMKMPLKIDFFISRKDLRWN